MRETKPKEQKKEEEEKKKLVIFPNAVACNHMPLSANYHLWELVQCVCARIHARSRLFTRHHSKPKKKKMSKWQSKAKVKRATEEKKIFIVDSRSFAKKKSIVPTTDVIFNGIVTHLVHALAVSGLVYLFVWALVWSLSLSCVYILRPCICVSLWFFYSQKLQNRSEAIRT